MAALSFVVAFRGLNLRWPLRSEDEIEVWTNDHEHVATLSAAIVHALLRHELDGLAVQAVLREELDGRKPLAVLPARRSAVPFSDEKRAELKARRRARKP